MRCLAVIALVATLATVAQAQLTGYLTTTTFASSRSCRGPTSDVVVAPAGVCGIDSQGNRVIALVRTSYAIVKYFLTNDFGCASPITQAEVVLNACQEIGPNNSQRATFSKEPTMPPTAPPPPPTTTPLPPPTTSTPVALELLQFNGTYPNCAGSPLSISVFMSGCCCKVNFFGTHVWAYGTQPQLYGMINVTFFAVEGAQPCEPAAAFESYYSSYPYGSPVCQAGVSLYQTFLVQAPSTRVP